MTCELCESAKGMQTITKVWEGGWCPAVGDEIHSDLWGKAPVESINHKLYYISFTDDHSRYTNIYFHSKDEAFIHYWIYEAWLSTQLCRLGNITGFETRDGLRVGVRGVRVRVAELIPSPNPYPQDGLTGYGGFFHGFSHSYFFTKNNFISLYNNFFL